VKRYTKRDLTEDEIVKLLSNLGEVIEIVGSTCRIETAMGDGTYQVLAIPTFNWCELEEKEA